MRADGEGRSDQPPGPLRSRVPQASWGRAHHAPVHMSNTHGRHSSVPGHGADCLGPGPHKPSQLSPQQAPGEPKQGLLQSHFPGGGNPSREGVRVGRGSLMAGAGCRGRWGRDGLLQEAADQQDCSEVLMYSGEGRLKPFQKLDVFRRRGLHSL